MFRLLAAGWTTDAPTAMSAAWIGGAALVFGLLLWLAGSRFSQALVTLAAVAVGTWLGKRLPGWMDWGIDPIGTAFGGALVLGLAGYIYHRMWVGVGLGCLLSAWAALATWILVCPHIAWSWPELQSWDLAPLCHGVWQELTPDAQRIMPWSAGGAALAGMTLAALRPRIAERLFYSMLGLSVVVTAGVLMHRLTWLQRLLPGGLSVQLGVAAGLVAVGMIVQWWLGPRAVSVASSPAPPDQQEEA